MKNIKDIIDGLTPAFQDDGVISTIPESWMQGRTTYGGLTAGLALASAAYAFGELPPLSSALIAFIGPVDTHAHFKPSLLRRGRSTTFAGVDVLSQEQLGARCTFAFSSPRPSHINEPALPAPEVPAPSHVADYFNSGTVQERPVFTQHFEFRLAHGAMPLSGVPRPHNLIWVRYKSPPAQDTPLLNCAALLALADALPPAAMSGFSKAGPISSVTWAVNLLTANPTTEDGWWLLEAQAEATHDGVSSQRMRIWNSKGAAILSGMQSIAIFV
jgi:acyl-CoA thioesterase